MKNALSIAAIFIALGSMLMSQPSHAEVPPRLVGDWKIEVGPGEFAPGFKLAVPTQLAIAPSVPIVVKGEAMGPLPVFNPASPGFWRGAKLPQLIAQECSAAGLLIPDSLVLHADTPDSAPLIAGKDFDVDRFWATVGRLDGGALMEATPVFVDYSYAPVRIDSIALNKAGEARVVQGEQGTTIVFPPVLKADEMPVANVFLFGPMERLSEDSLYPISPEALKPLPTDPNAGEFIPQTLAKLRAGEPVTIVAWGDSVTCGGGVGDKVDAYYQNQFAKRLQERFPKSAIKMVSAGWGGANSKQYMDAPAGGPKDFKRDVLDPKPDLITIEFVNDAYLTPEQVNEHYAKIMDVFNNAGAEVILITPHFVRPDWMGAASAKIDQDPRPYVAGLRAFAAANEVTIADASLDWGRLMHQGIPYMTLEANAINHPDERGHRLFADALMRAFPEK